MDKRFFNIFAKIYLYINKFSIVKNILEIQTSNTEEKYQQFKNKDITEIEEKVDEIINNKLNDSKSKQYLYDILLLVDYVYQGIQDGLSIKEDYLNTMYRDKIQLRMKNKNSINRKSGAYPELSSYFNSIIPIVKKSNSLYEINNYYIENDLQDIRIAIIPGNLFTEQKK